MAALRQNGEVFGDLRRQAPGAIRRANLLLLRSALALGAALTGLASLVALLGDDPGATNRALRFVDIVGPDGGSSAIRGTLAAAFRYDALAALCLIAAAVGVVWLSAAYLRAFLRAVPATEAAGAPADRRPGALGALTLLTLAGLFAAVAAALVFSGTDGSCRDRRARWWRPRAHLVERGQVAVPRGRVRAALRVPLPCRRDASARPPAPDLSSPGRCRRPVGARARRLHLLPGELRLVRPDLREPRRHGGVADVADPVQRPLLRHARPAGGRPRRVHTGACGLAGGFPGDLGGLRGLRRGARPVRQRLRGRCPRDRGARLAVAVEHRDSARRGTESRAHTGARRRWTACAPPGPTSSSSGSCGPRSKTTSPTAACGARSPAVRGRRGC